MAKLWVQEYAKQGTDASGFAAPVGEEPALASQVIDFAAGSTVSAAFHADTKFIRLWSDAESHVAFGTGALAAGSGNLPIGAKEKEFIGIRPLDATHLAVVAA